ncbi:uncharacterized protein EI90DRAFT_3128758 [Cantharellus anzutake]|uniref:uncharacterized protein n=1 Tax=Cantharellus anzutake TaxID=1750568 RepID=UPI0019056B25|nr:uncharacterized protein EI90DRAFT_3128758 [Cantharellus anzutake]KAF8325411.1 hypothetical protein EI90DRAFT_3128758 [Cantharellus anzutake]
MSQPKAEDATLRNMCPTAQRMFDSFIWATQARYQLNTEEMSWFHRVVSDRFVEDFSIPYRVRNWKPNWDRTMDLQTIERHIPTHVFTAEMSYMVWQRVAARLMSLKEKLSEVNTFPSIMLVNYDGQTLPILILASTSVEGNEQWEVLLASSSTPSREHRRPQPRKMESPIRQNASMTSSPSPRKMPDPLAMPSAQDKGLHAGELATLACKLQSVSFDITPAGTLTSPAKCVSWLIPTSLPTDSSSLCHIHPWPSTSAPSNPSSLPLLLLH